MRRARSRSGRRRRRAASGSPSSTQSAPGPQARARTSPARVQRAHRERAGPAGVRHPFQIGAVGVDGGTSGRRAPRRSEPRICGHRARPRGPPDALRAGGTSGSVGTSDDDTSHGRRPGCRCGRHDGRDAARRPRPAPPPRSPRPARGPPRPSAGRRGCSARPTTTRSRSSRPTSPGLPRQRRTGLGWRGLGRPAAAAAEPSLTVTEVDAALERDQPHRPAPGRGRRAPRRVEALFGRATAEEQPFLRALVFENLRQGAQDSVLLDAIAKAAGRSRSPPCAARRCSRRPPARSPRPRSPAGPRARGVRARARAARCGRCWPRSAPDVAERADARWPRTDARGSSTASSTASGSRCTASATRCRSSPAASTTSPSGSPRWSRRSRRSPVDPVVLDGEVIALRPDGRPRPFQETGVPHRQHASTSPSCAQRVPLTAFFFDLLHLDGEDLLDAAGSRPARRCSPRRCRRTCSGAARGHRTPPTRRRRSSTRRVAAGHEGVV